MLSTVVLTMGGVVSGLGIPDGDKLGLELGLLDGTELGSVLGSTLGAPLGEELGIELGKGLVNSKTMMVSSTVVVAGELALSVASNFTVYVPSNVGVKRRSLLDLDWRRMY